MSKDELNPQQILNSLNRMKDGFSMTKGKAMDMITEANVRQWNEVINLIQTLIGENQKLKKQLDDAISQLPKTKTIQKTEMPKTIPKTEKPPKNTK